MATPNPRPSAGRCVHAALPSAMYRSRILLTDRDTALKRSTDTTLFG